MFVSPGPQSGFIQTSYGNYVSFSWPKYRALRDRSTDIFEGVLARYPFEVSIAAKGQTDRTRGELVSGNYFAVLGVHPSLGRLIGDDDARTRGGSPVAVLSYGYWTRRFGGDPAILNQPITVNGESLTVIGVAQSGFQSVGAGEAPAVFVPITMQGSHSYRLRRVRKRPRLLAQHLRPPEARHGARKGRGRHGGALARSVWRTMLRNCRAGAGWPRKVRHPQTGIATRSGRRLSSIRGEFSMPIYLLMGMVDWCC